MRFTRFAPLAGLMLLAACSARVVPPSAPPPAPAPTPAPSPTPTPTPVPSFSSWMDAPATPGDWRWRQADGDSAAEFSPPGGSPSFAVWCTRQGVFLSRIGGGGTPREDGNFRMTVRTETLARTLPANLSGMAMRTLLDPRDPLLDAIAFSKGRFAVEIEGAPTLYLPAYPEISRVIEDCR